jgi:hypothetical protein
MTVVLQLHQFFGGGGARENVPAASTDPTGLKNRRIRFLRIGVRSFSVYPSRLPPLCKGRATRPLPSVGRGQNRLRKEPLAQLIGLGTKARRN